MDYPMADLCVSLGASFACLRLSFCSTTQTLVAAATVWIAHP